MEGEAPKGGQWTAAMPQVSYTDLEEKLARAQRERDEALEQQTATSEVLQVISSSPGELEPVFQAVLANATRICEAKFANLLLYDGRTFRNVALHNAPSAWIEKRRREPIAWPIPTSPLGRVVSTKQVVHVADLVTEQAYIERDPATVAVAELAEARTLLIVPMLKEDELIGIINHLPPGGAAIH